MFRVLTRQPDHFKVSETDDFVSASNDVSAMITDPEEQVQCAARIVRELERLPPEVRTAVLDFAANLLAIQPSKEYRHD